MGLDEVWINTNLVCNWFDISKTCLDTFAPQWQCTSVGTMARHCMLIQSQWQYIFFFSGGLVK
jgi:hypothetical protein